MKRIILLLLFCLITLSSTSQILTEGFENTTGPDADPSTNWTLGSGNWAVFDNGSFVSTVRWGITSTVATPPIVYQGVNAAQVNRENSGAGTISEEYLATPEIDLTAVATNAVVQLKFYTRTFTLGNQGTRYEIRIAPSFLQDQPFAYTTIQTWTEDQLTADYNAYEEKIVDLSSQIGNSICVAFVKVNEQETGSIDGDRWLIDDVRVVLECPVPSGANASNVSLSSATLNWVTPAPNATSEVFIVNNGQIPVGQFPVGNGTSVNGTLAGTNYNYSFIANQTTAGVPFTANTTYQYYIRTVCSGSNQSVWIGPFDFTTQSPGLSCSAPISITTLPYSTTDNTANYADNTDTPQPAACAGTATNFMTGNDVFYSYTPATSGAISITMTPNANASGIFVYQGCANVGVDCLAGVANTGNGVRSIPSLAVTAGQTYIIVLSSNAAPQTYGYSLVIQQLNCAQPDNLNAPLIGQTTANLSWGNPGGATSWEVVVQPAGGPVPPGAGITTTNNTAYPVPGPLTQNTPYQYWVRADCGNGTFSAWAGPFLFTTLCDAFPVPFQEGFNSNSTTQNCWTVLNVNADTDQWDMDFATNPFEGNQVAALNTDFNAGNNNDWLISPQIILTGNQRLKFHYRVQSTGEPNDFRVVLSTTGTAPASFTNTLIPLTSYNNITYQQAIVNLSAYNGPVNIAWHVPNAGLDGWRIFIDNVVIEDIPTCAEPSALSATAVLTTSATITWTNGNTETAWEYVVLPCGSPAPTAATPATGAISPGAGNLTGLAATTCYDVYIRAVCSATDSSPWSNPTSITTQIVPPACGGVFTDPEGPTAQYLANTNSTVTICPDTPNEIVTVTFTSFNTEANWDGLYVFDGDSILSPQIPSANGPGFGQLTTPGAFWGDLVGANLPGPFTSTDASGCLTFRFITDGIIVDDGWIANVTCGPAPTCRKPNNLTDTATTTNGATISWTQLPNPDTSVATEWHVLALPCGSPAPTANATGFETVTNVTNYIYTTLNPATCYDVYVRASCSATDVSLWGGPTSFTTLCVPYSVPFFEGFNTDSTSQTCWTVLNVNGDGDAWNMNTNFNTFEGNECAALTTDFNAGVNNDWLISPTIILNGNQRLKYHYRVQSTGEPNDFRVVLSTSGIDPTSFTQTLVPLATYDNITYIQNIVNMPGVTGPVNIAWHVPAGGLDGWRIFIDNVIIEDIPACAEPSGLTATQLTPTSALLGWTQPNTNVTQWEVILQAPNLPAPLASQSGTVVNVNPALFTGLNPATQYTFYVRAVCGPGLGFSGWSNGFTFSTLLINDNCDNAIFAPVNSSSICQQTVPGTLNGATASATIPLTAPCIGTPDDDVWYQFVATNSYLNIALQNIVGSTNNLNIAVYSGNCGALTQISCSAANALTTVVNNMTVGETYYIRIYSNQNTPQTSTFNLCVSTPSTCITGSTVCNLTDYQNTTGVTSLGTIGCLASSPNPYYFTVQVATSGPINFLLTQSTTPGGAPNIDVDYAAWGPFANQPAACTAIGEPITLAPGIGVPVTQQTGCSFSAASTETLNIANAVAGQYYIILITNFSNQPGYITLTQTNLGTPGHGTTNCCLDAFFTYSPAAYCKTTGATNPVATITNGSTAGVFSCTNPGLVFANTATGEINLAASAPGNYLITNTVAANATCDVKTANYTINITEPLVALISYPVSSACTSQTDTIAVNLSGDTGGAFSASPPGLSINPTTGVITPSLSGSGTYTISYSYSTSSVCNAAAPSTTIEIIATPLIPQPSNISSCNPVTLPSLTVGNYFSQPGGIDPINSATVAASQIVYVYGNNNGCITERSFNVTITNIPQATVDLVQANCTTPTGSITITSPLNTVGSVASDLFISEITDENVGSLSYIEIYNGTGTPKNLANYKLKVFNNGNTNPSTNCDFPLSGTLNNDDVYVIAIGTNTNVGGVVPDLTIANCAGFNTNDNVRLSTASNVDIDSWGRTDGIDFTPNNQSGYTYRRINTATVPSLVWNPNDWTAIDPQDYTNVGSYIFNSTPTNTYEYQLDNGTFQSSINFTGVSVGNHTITVREVATGCLSIPLNVTINDITLTGTVTDFTLPTSICQSAANPLPIPFPNFTTGGEYSVVPATSDLVINSSTGEINLASSVPGTYTIRYFVPENTSICQNEGESTQEITINPVVVPTFTQVDAICQGGILNPLPTTATNGVEGTWSPALNNNDTTEYTFTPENSQCATSTTMTIDVIPANIVPTFTQVDPICQGGTLNALPTTSNNGITGSWLPALNNNDTTEYTFTPDGDQCAVNTTMTIVVTLPSITPTFTQVSPICQGGTLNALPTTSTNNITGSWSPALNNNDTTEYTFTPDGSQCAINTTMTIVVNPNTTPTFDSVVAICQGETLNPLPTTSLNGIDGTWSPALNNNGTTVYTFTPTSGLCPLSTTLEIQVNQRVVPTFDALASVCIGATSPSLPSSSLNGIAGTWNPATISTTTSGTSSATFTPNTGECATTASISLTVSPSFSFALEGDCLNNAYTISVADASGFDINTATYQWLIGTTPIDDTNSASFNVSEYLNDTPNNEVLPLTFSVIVTSNGCSVTQSFEVDSITCLIQRGISVNNDGKNDTFDLSSYDVKKLTIFNRYGTIAYEKTDYVNEWKGQTNSGDELPDGTYFYTIEFNNGGETITGWIYVSRVQ
jgi:gliding motility-associated-like protein